ncbi:hypothetical protein EXIGLDRAFT_728291 [Exidia glandulosa HHB12029]|uniref:Uncharacterized protein n=1 Tax=Exidia glandulosa HHB12029 TaxID=1314781 RepID=A0A165CYR1_EXIGL|nr:hypothetical protein EXIGLDRAFT_728291 [Exidia glandulosa HHB12029]
MSLATDLPFPFPKEWDKPWCIIAGWAFDFTQSAEIQESCANCKVPVYAAKPHISFVMHALDVLPQNDDLAPDVFSRSGDALEYIVLPVVRKEFTEHLLDTKDGVKRKLQNGASESLDKELATEAGEVKDEIFAKVFGKDNAFKDNKIFWATFHDPDQMKIWGRFRRGAPRPNFESYVIENAVPCET